MSETNLAPSSMPAEEPNWLLIIIFAVIGFILIILGLIFQSWTCGIVGLVLMAVAAGGVPNDDAGDADGFPDM